MTQRDTNRVLARRKELGLRLVDVAARAHRKAPLISMLEDGYQPAGPRGRETMCLVAAALESEPWLLWPEEFEEAPGSGEDAEA